MRAARIVQRKQVKKSMKNRIKQLRSAGAVAFIAGREQGRLDVLNAASHLTYEEGNAEPTVQPS